MSFYLFLFIYINSGVFQSFHLFNIRSVLFATENSITKLKIKKIQIKPFKAL